MSFRKPGQFLLVMQERRSRLALLVRQKVRTPQSLCPQRNQISLAARRTAARLLRPFRLHRAHKSAHELFIDLRRDGIHVNA